jgi:hypothetical protein
MKIIGMLVAAVCLAVLMPACGKSGSKQRANSIAIAKAKVTVNEIKKPVKTAKGTSIRIFEVTPEASADASPAMGNMPTGTETSKSNKSLVAVIGDASVPVEITDALTAVVGGKQVRIDLVVIGPAVVLISASKPANGIAAQGISVDAALKKIEGGTLDIPQADTLP